MVIRWNNLIINTAEFQICLNMPTPQSQTATSPPLRGGGHIYLPFQTAGAEARIPASCIFRGGENVECWDLGARLWAASWERIVRNY